MATSAASGVDVSRTARWLQGRRALVTGAGRGIGRNIALGLGRVGADVALVARTKTEIGEGAAQIIAMGRRALAVAGDVARPGDVAAAFQAARESLGGGIDILVNAAGIAPTAPLARTTDEMFRAVIETNLFGSFYAIREAAPSMIEGSFGRIINVASIAARKGAPYLAAYAASKHGLLGLTRAVAAEFGPTGVTVNALCPGFVETPMLNAAVGEVAERTRRAPADVRAFMAQSSPQNRIFTVEEVTGFALFLCSDEARGVTGQALGIDGGMSA